MEEGEKMKNKGNKRKYGIWRKEKKVKNREKKKKVKNMEKRKESKELGQYKRNRSV